MVSLICDTQRNKTREHTLLNKGKPRALDYKTDSQKRGRGVMGRDGLEVTEDSEGRGEVAGSLVVVSNLTSKP